MSILGFFRRDRRGNVAVMFALSMIPLIGMVGAAVDYSRLSRVHTKLADALDAAILAAGSHPAMSDQDLYDFVKSWIAVHMDTSLAKSWQLELGEPGQGRHRRRRLGRR